MSELPIMFPVSATDIVVGSKFIADASTFPEFGSEQYREVMESFHPPTSEFVMSLSRLSLRCTTDKSFDTVTTEAKGILLGLDECTIHVVSDSLGLTKVGAGSLGARLIDDDKVHCKIVDVNNRKELMHSWADLTFGTGEECTKFVEDLPLPFQMSIFLAPNASLYNIGMDSSILMMSDFSTLFGFLGFISVYFCESELGYPYLRAMEFLNETKQGMMGEDEIDETTSESLTDFRLWLSRPAVWIPVEPTEFASPFLILATEKGIWYRCATIELFLSQECIVKALTMSFVDKEDAEHRASLSLSRSLTLGKSLVEGLSLGLRIDYSGATNHSDYSLKIPYNGEWDCNLTSQRISMDPVVVSKPTICKPVETVDRFLGPAVCEMTFVVDVLPAAFAALYNLFIGAAEESGSDGGSQSQAQAESAIASESDHEETEEEDTEAIPEATFSFAGGFGDLRVFVLDPVLGPHLPVAVLSVASLNVTASQFSSEALEEEPVRGEAPPGDLQVYVDGNVWADSFKLGLTRSWEPLLESYHFILFYEKSLFRGSGITLTSDTSLHLNVTGAMLLVVDEVADSMLRVVSETFDSTNSGAPSEKSDHRRSETRERCITCTDDVSGLSVVHEFPRAVSNEDRVAFSVKNMTGQRMRAYRFENGGLDSKVATVSYVENGMATKLLFQPSVSKVSNMKVVEVEFPGLENSPNHNNAGSGSVHAIDIQIPGFQWMREVQIDNFGRRFIDLTPRSSLLRERAKEDWRIANVMKLLVEVGLENGGRELTAKSIFSIVNKTTHTLSLVLHPNTSFSPDIENEADVQLETGSIHQIPVLLLESALRMAGGMELGCIWLRPSNGQLPSTFTTDGHDDEPLVAQFSSRPVRLGKTVSDSALLFDENKGLDIPPERAETGIQVSCPVIGGSGQRELAPFCYAVEVGRSPVVKARQREHRKNDKNEMVNLHGPVAYTLSVYAPFVVANLLPEPGRFELMHAVRKTVLWFADLEPGQQVSVHSVGLDAPLLLLINLRFCRTPIGEGALVHHGVDPPPEAREHLGRLRSIGKAGKAVTMQLGKTLTALGESPDKRGHDRLYLAQNKENQPIHDKKGHHNTKRVAKVSAGDSATEDVDGKTYRVDTTIFFPENCVDETVVVDGVGQRLTLGIENIRGGGGQRRISVYCPFWIINTTEHALAYRQERSKTFVSGSVVSPKMDGSLTLSGGHVGEKAKKKAITEYESSSTKPLNNGTIFAGTPGALATSPGRCELTPGELTHLLEEDLSLDDLSSLAFMFNFHEGSMPGGYQKLCVRLHDGTGLNRYQSDWSRGFTLDSVGISQVVDMNCKDARALELTMVTQNAPGHLFKYTKILRFLPRYVVVNNLPYPVRLWQDNSIFRPPSAADVTLVNSEKKGSTRWRLVTNRKKKDTGKINQYEALWGKQVDITAEEGDVDFPLGTTAHPSALHVMSANTSSWKPFNLPDTRGDRQLRIGLGGHYNLTSSISADVPGEHTLRVTRAVDLRLLKHVSTRASPEYSITLPPRGETSFSGELGIWFETEWGTDRSLIVKAIRNDSYCYNKTDVHVGDELLLIDAAPVTRMTFAEAMNVLRTRINEIKTTPSEPPRRASSMRRSSLSFRFGSSTQSATKQEQEPERTIITPLTLTFRTVEERLRRVRLKAARNSAAKDQLQSETSSSNGANHGKDSDSHKFIKAELKTLHKCMYLVLGTTGTVPYEVHNRTKNSTIYFRQRGCHNHQWRILKPGASELYCWEEPMKTKRLTVRVATEESFVFFSQNEPSRVGAEEEYNSVSELDAHASKVAENGRAVAKKRKRIKDEEEAVFSSSTSVRLEEIGFKDYLHYRSAENKPRQLELEVDVVGSTRVLLVRDSSTELNNENQLVAHLETLRDKCAEEEERYQELRDLRSELPSTENLKDMSEDDITSSRVITDTARNLMQDYPEEKTLTSCHQMVVEVLEATGLSPDNYVGVCNPYVEVYLQKGSSGRKNLFQRRKSQRTYYVRRSVNPQWNSQSFIFNVPEEAVSVTRGHAVKLKVRNFRRMGTHSVLGRAQIDLHSVRGHSPLLGWFPLAGRTGRRELENSLSHWGRGSVKLKIHWVYSTSGLLDYFLLLSEARLKDLNESVDGMAGQVEKWREEEQRRQERIDGFKAVRVNDLVPVHRKQSTPGNFQPPFMRMESELGTSVRPIDEYGVSIDENVAITFDSQDDSAAFSSGRMAARKSVIAHGQLPSIRNEVEDQISLRRQQLQMGTSLATQNMRSSVFVSNNTGNFGGTASLSRFRTWEEAKVFFNDESLEIDFDGQEWNLSLRRTSPKHSFSDDDSVGERQLAGKLKVPSGAPSLIKDAAENHAALFAVSRASVERFARSSLRAALNPGGWLTIRPIQALNLPDTCNGMFVKVRYGSETYISETVDSTVYPTWFNPDESSTDGPVSAESLEYFPGDLHVYVPPQKTSGSILISVVGEGQGQRVNVKSELGVLKIPLGAAITACVDSVEEYFDSQMNEHGTSPVYMRWFPLEDPKATQPIEGDRRAGSRPREAEKDSDHTFNDYFSPCIQLALFWNPEVDFPDGERDGPRTRRKTKISASNEELVASTGEKSAYSSVVDQYFNADIGQVSVALIDSRKAVELVSGCVCDIDVRYWVTKAKTRFGVSVGWFQLDQQDEYAREPIILAPTPSEYVATVFQILAVKDNLRSKNEVLSFEFIDFSIAEFDLTLEETLLSDIADFLSSLRLRGFLADTTSESDGATEDLSTISHERSLFELGAATQRNPESALLFLLSDDNDEMKGRQRVYIEQLFLGVVKFNLSYLKGTKETRVLDDPILGIARQFESDKRAFGLQSSHHEKSDLVATWSQNTAQSSGGKFSLPTIFTSLFPNVSDAPVRLQGKALNHVFESPREIIQSIKKFYVNETLKQIYKIIGSLDFVGNPTMLFTSFLSGLRDLILIPSQAFIQDKNASSVGLGVAKGTLSLFSHSTSGFFGFTSKIFAVAGQALASVSFDKDYRQWHREQVVVEASNLNRTWKKRGVQSVHQMIVRPLGDILLGVGSGITGIVVAPVRGYKRGGPTGFIIGLAAGAAGVFVRPAVGVLDALSHFTASIHDIARSVNVLDKRFQPPIKYRLPYVFGTRMILMSFDDSVCRAFHLLKRFPLKTKHRAGHGGAEIIVHVEVLHNIGIDTYAIVTSSRLIIIRLVSGSNSPTLCWQVSLVGNAKVSSQVAEHGHNGFALTVFLKERETQEVDPSIERSSGPDSLPSNGPGTENEPSVGHGIINSAYEPGTEAFDHGTSRSEAGELITWYSVVAEYQYRRQLARLHNGIACVTGNFDDVIRDQTLGRPGSTQFFTSFGIFHFEEKDSESLEQEAHASTLEDQMEAIPWRLDEDVVANDPEWLAIARKRAANASLEVPVMPLSAEQETSERSTAANQPSSGRVRKIARWITGRLPTIPDTDEENPPSPIRHDKGAEDGGMDSEDVGGLSPSVPNISNTTTGDETFVTANGETNSGNQSSTNSGNTPSFNTARQEASERNLGREGSEPNLARESFATALTAHGLSSTPASTVGRDSFITAYQGNSALTMDVSIQSDPSDHIDNEEDVSLERQGFISSKLPSKLAGASRNLSDQTAIHSNATPARTDGVSEIAETHTPTHVPSTDTERLVRMETIMEQLLIFSSEQALQNNTTRTQQTPSVANDLSLRGEIHELRMILQQQNQAEKEAQKEIELLRMQVNKLTEIVQQRPQESDQSSIDSNRVVPASIGFEEQDDIMAKI
uniref:C2 domain-containing protein n=1 Tax=Entomoneis paludosa TaxID=265537 RepID=A0A7S2Y632_9STRA